MVFRGPGRHVVKDRLDHGRGELGGTKSVTAAQDHRVLHDAGGFDRLADSGTDIKVERLAGRARLFGAVENGDTLDSGRHGVDHCLGIERTEQADDHQTDLLALGNLVINGCGNGLGAGTHHDDDFLGIRGAVIIKEVILAAGQGCEFVHGLLDDGRGGGVILIDRLTAGEVDVRILGRAAHHRAVRGKSALAVGNDQVLINNGAHIVVGQLLDLLDLV